MAFSISEFVQRIIYEIWDQYWEESGKVWDEFTSELGRIWGETSIWTMVRNVWFPWVGIPDVAQRLIDTLDAFQELQQDLALVPQRIAVDIVDDLIPVPKSWSNRVFRGDQVLRFFVRETLQFATDVQDMDLPAEVDVIKNVEKLRFVEKMKEKFDLDAVLGKAKGTVVYAIVIMVGTLAKQMMGLGLIVWAGVIVYRAHQEDFTSVVLKERALPQDSERVVSRPRTARQHRVNRRPGPDK